MDIIDKVVISWHILVSIISGILCSIIRSHISHKPIINLTIVDLIYRDCVIYIQLLTTSINIALSSCLLTNDKVLDFPLALFYATVLYYVISCAAISISVSSFLRLLSILNNSEEAGIQLLGLDDRAIVHIRIASLVISTLTIFFAFLVFNSVPPGMVVLVTRCQFHQHSMSSFYTRRSQKRKKAA